MITCRYDRWFHEKFDHVFALCLGCIEDLTNHTHHDQTNSSFSLTSALLNHSKISISPRVGRSAPRREQVRLAAVQAKRSVALSSRSVIEASASRRSARALLSHASKAA